uniref:hypothetical protein n=1 Tax=Endozoicomonas sp. SESOKO1 TaxID=2828742 RepID=UPI00214838C3
IARFKEHCCLRGLVLNGHLVTPDAVVEDFPDTPGGKLGILRFKEVCCLRSLPLYGQLVTPDVVVKGFQAARATLELATFKEKCCLKGLPLNGRRVTPDEVVGGFTNSPKGKLGIVLFKEQCCLKGLLLNGQPVTPDEVVEGFVNSPEGKLGIARFKEQCCLRGLLLNGQPVTPDAVVKAFPDSPEARLGITRFKAECCLKGLLLNGHWVTPDAVVKAFTDSSEGKLGVARFKEECCLRGLPLSGLLVTTETVVKDYQAVNATLELARFKEECCLRGLPLNGQLVTPDAVITDFPESSEGKLGIARFKAECCLKGQPLAGQPVTPDAVVKDFPESSEGKLGIAHFKAECCLKGLTLNGQQVTPHGVVKDFPDSPEGKLGRARFKEQCCLRGLTLNGHRVPPAEVVRDFPNSPEGKLGIARFKAKCCQKGLTLNSQQVTPDEVVKDYERGGWLLEKAIFYSQLALSARELNGNHLDNQKVLAAFNEAPGDHSSRQARYLIQRLKQSQRYDETSEAQDILQTAWQILNIASAKDDEQHRLQCVLKFMAMQYELPIDHQRVSAEQVLQSIKTLRKSFQNSRLHFFFLAYCYIKRRPVDGREIHKNQVLGYLRNFPEGSKLRHSLGLWLEQYCAEANIAEANIIDELLFKRNNVVAPGRNSDSHHQYTAFASQQKASVVTGRESPVSVDKTLKQLVKTGGPGFPEKQFPRLSALMLKTLEIIQEANASFTNPTILITGSYARFLQNRCLSFKDIDVICTTAESARTLFDKLQALNPFSDSEIPKSIIIWQIPGCQAIKLPNTYNIHLKDGDLGMKAMGLQVSVDARVSHKTASRLAIHVPGVVRPVWCLSFAEETQLMNDTLKHLADQLDPLTEQLQQGVVFDLPRTILFNNPKNTAERIYGLLMRSLLTLNKARQFIALHSQEKTEKPGGQPNPLKEKLHALTENLQMKLTGHVRRNDFENRVNGWLSTNHHVNEYEIRRKDFVKTLLTLMHPEKDQADSLPVALKI